AAARYRLNNAARVVFPLPPLPTNAIFTKQLPDRIYPLVANGFHCRLGSERGQAHRRRVASPAVPAAPGLRSWGRDRRLARRVGILTSGIPTPSVGPVRFGLPGDGFVDPPHDRPVGVGLQRLERHRVDLGHRLTPSSGPVRDRGQRPAPPSTAARPTISRRAVKARRDRLVDPRPGIAPVVLVAAIPVDPLHRAPTGTRWFRYRRTAHLRSPARYSPDLEPPRGLTSQAA